MIHRIAVPSLVLALSSLLSAGLMLGACGQSVATCGDVCPSGSSASCATSCTGLQASCSDTVEGPDAGVNPPADFQALLTCIANASGSYSDVPPDCKPLMTALESECLEIGSGVHP